MTALAGCAAVPPLDVPRPASHAWEHPEETAVAKEFARQAGGSGDRSGFYLLSSGIEAFGMRAALADSASRTLDLQYYIVRQDATSQLLLYRLLRAAQRGVRVRLLVDDLYAVGQEREFASFAAHPNVEVRVFNPFARRGRLGLAQLFEFLGDSERLNRRMHNKLWIADNAAAIMGGRNLGDEYFDAHPGTNFADLDTLVVGPAVRQVSRSFDDYWNSESAVPIAAFITDPPGGADLARFDHALTARIEAFGGSPYAHALEEASLGRRLREGQLPLVMAPAIVLYDSPESRGASSDEATPREPMLRPVRPLLDGAQHEILVISPYFVPGAQGVEMLGSLTRRGVRVRVLTNSLASTDAPIAHAGYARRRVALLAAGIELYEARPEPRSRARLRGFGSSSGASLHAKAIVIDGRHVVLGSMNMDARSRLYNTEVAVLIDSPSLGSEVAALFDDAAGPGNAFRLALDAGAVEPAALCWVADEAGTEKRYRREPLAGFWRRLYAAFLGALAPDGML